MGDAGPLPSSPLPRWLLSESLTARAVPCVIWGPCQPVLQDPRFRTDKGRNTSSTRTPDSPSSGCHGDTAGERNSEAASHWDLIKSVVLLPPSPREFSGMLGTNSRASGLPGHKTLGVRAGITGAGDGGDRVALHVKIAGLIHMTELALYTAKLGLIPVALHRTRRE